jgi:hypothetical protein
VVAISGSHHEGCKEDAELLGAKGFFLKTSKLEDWTQIVRDICKLARVSEEYADPSLPAVFPTDSNVIPA